MAKKSLHDGHRRRVKDNVLENGFSQLEEHKLLELMLFYSIPRGDTNELAHLLIDKTYGSLEGVLNASVESLQRVKGVGESTAIMLATMGEIYRKISRTPKPVRRVYKSTDALKRLTLSQLEGREGEGVVLFCFDENRKLTRCATISEGDLISSEVDMKAIVTHLVDSEASVAVLAHNHPTSSAMPSAFDIDATRTVSVTLRKINCVLVDHIIVGGNGEVYSMQEDPRFSGMFY